MFPEIDKDQELLEAILGHLAVADKGHLSDEQKVLVSGEFDRLRCAILLKKLDSTLAFDISVREKAGDFIIHGTVGDNGEITIISRTKTFFMCPVCLAGDTRVGTSHGQLATISQVSGALVLVLVLSMCSTFHLTPPRIGKALVGILGTAHDTGASGGDGMTEIRRKNMATSAGRLSSSLRHRISIVVRAA